MSHPYVLLASAVLGVGILIYGAVTMFNQQQQNQPHGYSQRRRRRGDPGTSDRNQSWYSRDCEDEDEVDKKKSRKSRSTVQQKKEDNAPRCSICLESFNDLVNGGHSLCMIRECSHVFCEKCIKASLRRTASCPKCRKPATMENLTFVYL